MEVPLQLPVVLRCHVTVLSANHVEPNVTVSFDDVDMTSQFVRSQGDDDVTSADYVSEFEWNVTSRRHVLDVHASNWSCSALTSAHYPPMMTSSLVYVTRILLYNVYHS